MKKWGLQIFLATQLVYIALMNQDVLCPHSLWCYSCYQVANTSRGPITIQACIGAAGDVLSPMVIFPGQRFHYNPLEGFPDAYLGRSDNRWMDTELFFSWSKDHFLPHVSGKNVQRPILLLVDDNSTHLKTAELCAEENIILYTFLAHASHSLQTM